jgi:hypothetical protein
LLELVVLPDEVASLLNPEDLRVSENQIILRSLLAWRSRGSYDFEMFCETLPEEVRERAAELHALDVPLPDDGKAGVAVESLLARLRRVRLEAQLQRGSQLLEEVSPEDRGAALAHLAELMRERRTLEEELDRLSIRALQAPVVGRADQGTMDQDSGRL